MEKKKMMSILLSAFVVLFICVAMFQAVQYPIRLNINSGDVALAKIEYYGDGIHWGVNERQDLEELVRALNKLRLKEHEDMSYLLPNSGLLIVDLYNNSGECIESLQFYDWVYRGGEYSDKERKEGAYFSAQKGFALGNFYILCDELCGDPFDTLQYKWLYWLR